MGKGKRKRSKAKQDYIMAQRMRCYSEDRIQDYTVSPSQRHSSMQTVEPHQVDSVVQNFALWTGRRDSLVDYCKPPLLVTGTVPSGVFCDTGCSTLPLICTTPCECEKVDEEYTSQLNESECVDIVISALFPNNMICMNGKSKELSASFRSEIKLVLLSILDDRSIFRLQQMSNVPRSSSNEDKDIIRVLFFDSVDRIFSTLIHDSRFENIYGLSPRNTIILGICNSMQETTIRAHHALYEAVLDYSESERESVSVAIDDLYLQNTTYGQIHRLVELWQFFVSAFYEKYSAYLFTHKEASPMKVVSVKELYSTLYILIRLTGITSRYHDLLLSGLLKLFYIDQEEIHVFLRVIVKKWPISSSKRAVDLLQLLHDLLEQCHILKSAAYEKDITKLIMLFCKLINEAQAEVCMETIRILDDDKMLTGYIVTNHKRVHCIEQSINQNRNHWSESIKEVGDDLFDHLLDYV